MHVYAYTRIMLEHLSGRASMKRRGKSRREKRRGEKEREEKKGGRNKREEEKRDGGGRKKIYAPPGIESRTLRYRSRLVRHVQ